MYHSDSDDTIEEDLIQTLVNKEENERNLSNKHDDEDVLETFHCQDNSKQGSFLSETSIKKEQAAENMTEGDFKMSLVPEDEKDAKGVLLNSKKEDMNLIDQKGNTSGESKIVELDLDTDEDDFIRNLVLKEEKENNKTQTSKPVRYLFHSLQSLDDNLDSSDDTEDDEDFIRALVHGEENRFNIEEETISNKATLSSKIRDSNQIRMTQNEISENEEDISFTDIFQADSDIPIEINSVSQSQPAAEASVYAFGNVSLTGTEKSVVSQAECSKDIFDMPDFSGLFLQNESKSNQNLVNHEVSLSDMDKATLNGLSEINTEEIKSKSPKERFLKTPAFDLSTFEETQFEENEDITENLALKSKDNSKSGNKFGIEDKIKTSADPQNVDLNVETNTLERSESEEETMAQDEMRNFIAISENLEIVEKFALRSDISLVENKKDSTKTDSQVLQIDKLDFEYIDESVPFESLQEHQDKNGLDELFDHEIKEVKEIKEGLSILSMTLSPNIDDRTA